MCFIFHFEFYSLGICKKSHYDWVGIFSFKYCLVNAFGRSVRGICVVFFSSFCFMHSSEWAQRVGAEQSPAALCILKQALRILRIVTRQPNRTELNWTEANRQSQFSGHFVFNVFCCVTWCWCCEWFLCSLFFFLIRRSTLKTNKMKLINWTYLLPLSYFISTCSWLCRCCCCCCSRSSFNRWAKSTHTQ